MNKNKNPVQEKRSHLNHLFSLELDQNRTILILPLPRSSFLLHPELLFIVHIHQVETERILPGKHLGPFHLGRQSRWQSPLLKLRLGGTSIFQDLWWPWHAASLCTKAEATMWLAHLLWASLKMLFRSGRFKHREASLLLSGYIVQGRSCYRAGWKTISTAKWLCGGQIKQHNFYFPFYYGQPACSFHYGHEAVAKKSSWRSMS